MKGYKATYNMKCLDFIFEVGKTYEIEGELEICRNGFHFCRKMEYTANYYPPTNTFILLEVEALGDIQHGGDKSVTSRIKILRVVPKEEYTFKTYEYEWDDRGNMISETTPCGLKYSYEYDDRNNKISRTYPSGRSYSYEYDDQNNMISMTTPDGYKYTV